MPLKKLQAGFQRYRERQGVSRAPAERTCAAIGCGRWRGGWLPGEITGDLAGLDLHGPEHAHGQVATFGQQAAQQMLGAHDSRTVRLRLFRSKADSDARPDREMRQPGHHVLGCQVAQHRRPDRRHPPHGLLKGSLADRRNGHPRFPDCLGKIVRQVNVDLRHHSRLRRERVRRELITHI